MTESNRLRQALELLDGAHLDDVTELSTSEQDRLKSLCDHWAQLAHTTKEQADAARSKAFGGGKE